MIDMSSLVNRLMMRSDESEVKIDEDGDMVSFGDLKGGKGDEGLEFELPLESQKKKAKLERESGEMQESEKGIVQLLGRNSKPSKAGEVANVISAQSAANFKDLSQSPVLELQLVQQAGGELDIVVPDFLNIPQEALEEGLVLQIELPKDLPLETLEEGRGADPLTYLAEVIAPKVLAQIPMVDLQEGSQAEDLTEEFVEAFKQALFGESPALVPVDEKDSEDEGENLLNLKKAVEDIVGQAHDVPAQVPSNKEKAVEFRAEGGVREILKEKRDARKSANVNSAINQTVQFKQEKFIKSKNFDQIVADARPAGAEKSVVLAVIQKDAQSGKLSVKPAQLEARKLKRAEAILDNGKEAAVSVKNEGVRGSVVRLESPREIGFRSLNRDSGNAPVKEAQIENSSIRAADTQEATGNPLPQGMTLQPKPKGAVSLDNSEDALEMPQKISIKRDPIARETLNPQVDSGKVLNKTTVLELNSTRKSQKSSTAAETVRITEDLPRLLRPKNHTEDILDAKDKDLEIDADLPINTKKEGLKGSTNMVHLLSNSQLRQDAGGSAQVQRMDFGQERGGDEGMGQGRSDSQTGGGGQEGMGDKDSRDFTESKSRDNKALNIEEINSREFQQSMKAVGSQEASAAKAVGETLKIASYAEMAPQIIRQIERLRESATRGWTRIDMRGPDGEGLAMHLNINGNRVQVRLGEESGIDDSMRQELIDSWGRLKRNAAEKGIDLADLKIVGTQNALIGLNTNGIQAKQFA